MDQRRRQFAIRALCFPWLGLPLLAVLALATGFVAAFASEPDRNALIAQGQAIAATHCAPCHAVAKNDPSPVRTNDETSFRQLHQRFPIKMLSDALQTGTIEGHDEMPGFDLTQAEIVALVSYIDSFAPRADLKYLTQ